MPDGEETAQFLIDRCLMRPRFLINLVNHCKSNAVNSGRSKIDHIDIEKLRLLTIAIAEPTAEPKERSR